VLALTGAVALSLAAPAARAATTIGHTFTPTLKCVTSTFVQKSEASGVTSYAVPAGGAVITSFSTMAYSEPNEQMSFKVFRPTGTANEYTIVASTPTELLTPSALNTFPVRFPVKAGDRIGVYSDNAPCLTTSAGSEVLYDIGDFAPGITRTYSHPGAALLDVSARLEPDADGDGFGDETQDLCWTDPSTQRACPAPTIAGTAQVGQTLTASPNGAPMNPAYAWLRCDAAGEGCAAIPGETGTTHAVTAADETHTLRFRKTATDTSGSQTSESAPTAVVPVPPQILSGVAMTRTVFAVAAFATPVSARRHAPRGSAFRYTLSVAASVTLKISAVLPGRESGLHCLPPSKRLRGKHSCTRLALRGALLRRGQAGRNTVPFSGRIGTRALTPGGYQAAITATAAGSTSAVKIVRFTIVKE